jgi:hypothetical protein
MLVVPALPAPAAPPLMFAYAYPIIVRSLTALLVPVMNSGAVAALLPCPSLIAIAPLDITNKVLTISSFNEIVVVAARPSSTLTAFSEIALGYAGSAMYIYI